MPRARSRTKKTSYVLQVTCDKLPNMNETEFLQEIRERIQGQAPTGQFPPDFIGIDGKSPRVSVTKRVEEYVNPAKESSQ